MKIGILTQPLVNNYGGLMQAWALQQILRRMGHRPVIIDRHYTRRRDLMWPRRIASALKTELYILAGREERRVALSDDRAACIRRNIIPFIENRYLGISQKLYTDKALRQYVAAEAFDAFIVGSDQVWRPRYSPAIGTYFLDFLPADSAAKRIAYAASFGVDTWEYDSRQTRAFGALAKKFDLITVRESSGVKLVKDNLHCDATHVLDPTLLLEKDDYLGLVDNPTVPLHKSEGELFCYVLDQSAPLQAAIQQAREHTGMKAYYCNAARKATTPDDIAHLEECIFPPVEQWLQSFRDARMIITDSFHGCVFSIIFNKPFWVLGNSDRGTARFTSLLSTFGLEDRLVSSPDAIDWTAPINWAHVNDIRRKRAAQSLQLLSNTLK